MYPGAKLFNDWWLGWKDQARHPTGMFTADPDITRNYRNSPILSSLGIRHVNCAYFRVRGHHGSTAGNLIRRYK